MADFRLALDSPYGTQWVGFADRYVSNPTPATAEAEATTDEFDVTEDQARELLAQGTFTPVNDAAKALAESMKTPEEPTTPVEAPQTPAAAPLVTAPTVGTQDAGAPPAAAAPASPTTSGTAPAAQPAPPTTPVATAAPDQNHEG